jgi:hypothetical protein
MALTRFARDLEVRLLQEENLAATDLFSIPHAVKVLTAFGQAYGVLPEQAVEISPDQRAFLDRSRGWPKMARSFVSV